MAADSQYVVIQFTNKVSYARGAEGTKALKWTVAVESRAHVQVVIVKMWNRRQSKY